MVKKNVGLGRGFDSLIPSVQVDPDDVITEIKLSEIKLNPYQPRHQLDEAKIASLAHSIEEHGLLQPILVTKLAHGYQLVAGERRYQAFSLLKKDKIPAIVRSTAKQQQLEIALIENVQREDLSVVELALAYKRLADEFGLTYAQIGQEVGRSDKSVGNIIRLLQLPPPAREALEAETITEGHARQLLAIKDEARVVEVLELIIKNGWSVRETERFVKIYKNPKATINKAWNRVLINNDSTRSLEKKLGSDAKVRLKHLAKSSKLIIECQSEEKLNEVLKQLL